jgi:hypothetical protein
LQATQLNTFPFSNQQKPEMTVSKRAFWMVNGCIDKLRRPMDEWNTISTDTDIAPLMECEHLQHYATIKWTTW